MNDKDRVPLICQDCGNEFTLSYGKYRRKPADYHWRCKDCRYKHHAEVLRQKSASKPPRDKKKALKKIPIKKQTVIEITPNYDDWFNGLSNHDKKRAYELINGASGNSWKSVKREKLNERFERQFSESHLVNFYHITPVVQSANETTHVWAYGIYDKENQLCMLIDIDSADTYDDGQRLLSIPDGIKWCIISDHNFGKCFDYMCKTLIMNYYEYIDYIFTWCRSIPFPYPTYPVDELLKSFEQLKDMDCNDQHHENLALNTRVGDRLIQHFHHSIWHAHIRGDISPYEAWQDDETMRMIIQNRVIYQTYMNPSKVLQGFNITKKATKVSVFSAGRAKMIINRFLPEYNEVFDPFSGFSGRMLGTIALGKRYIGRDLSEIHVRESNQIIDFLHKYGFDFDAQVSVADAAVATGEYQCLFTCSPYGDKEIWEDTESSLSCDQWIDICLQNYHCKRYVFVVDETKKYTDNIAYVLTNKSHFGKNEEKIIVIEGAR